MITKSKAFVGRAALGVVALAGVAAAVPASARPYEGHGDWGRDRGRVEVNYGHQYYGGYRADWRVAPVYGPDYYYGYHESWRPAPVIVWHGHHGRW